MKDNTSHRDASTSNFSVDLVARAKAEMTEQNFLTDFEPDVLQEVQNSAQAQAKSALAAPLQTPSKVSSKDLTNLLWSSIDNVESKDLDQIEYAERMENGQIRVMVGIADVDTFVPKGSLTDKHAAQNATSVYTGVAVFPMLPDALSFDLTSLLDDKQRLSIVVDMVIDSTGAVVESAVYEALTENHAKLDYAMVGKWLEQGGAAPTKIADVAGLSEQLLLQDEAKERIKNLRLKQGALQLQTNEASTITSHGQVVGLELIEDNKARELIENFMIVANVAVSQFLERSGFASLRRVVQTPQHWDKIIQIAKSLDFDLSPMPDAKSLASFLSVRRTADPDRFPDLSLTIVKLLGRGEYVVEIPGQKDIGHFALAVQDYTHATAPNRRYADLVTQRLIKAAIAKKPNPYSLDELSEVAKQCTQMESAANRIERTMRKISAAALLSKHIGTVYDAIVTGIKGTDVFVRLFKPPAEGMIVENGQDVHVGDKVEVKLLSTNVQKAFVDFARV